jgi:hypothetical protein
MTEPTTNFELPCVKYENDQVIPLEHEYVACLIYKALSKEGNSDRLLALNLADKVVYRLTNWKGTSTPFAIQEIESMIRFVLAESGHFEASKTVGLEQNTVPQYNWG